MKDNQQAGNYGLLIHKLREFKRKYYLNEILRGGIYFTATLLVSYLLVTVLESIGRFDIAARTTLFYAFIATNAFILFRFILMPLLSLMELRKNLSYTQAANIVGRHFPEVKDKLLNTLQLHDQARSQDDTSRRQLIEASISQKTLQLKPVPFLKAVSYKKNRRYLKYALIPLAVLLILLLQAPNMLLESTARLVKHGEEIVEKAPFDFIITNDSLTAIRQEDFTLNMKVKGQELPAEVYLLVDDKPYKMGGQGKTDFNYTLKNLQKNLKLKFSAAGYESKTYDLKVLPKPVLQRFDVSLVYPAYIGKKNETLQNVGDLTIPAGTQVSWKFYTEYTEGMQINFSGDKGAADRKEENVYAYQKRFLKDDYYYIKTANNFLQSSDSIQYRVNVLQDAYPSIKVEKETDSSHMKNLYFTGEIADDYGIANLSFRYRFTKSADSAKMRMPLKSQGIGINKGRLLQAFYHYWDLNDLHISPGDELEYYFEVWDNDGVNGSKSSRSQPFYFKAPSLEDIEKNAEASNKEIENKMESALKQASKLQKEMQEARKKLFEKKNLDWQDKKMLEDLLKKQQELENTIEEIQKEHNKNVEQQNEFRKMDEKILEKHKQLQEMFDKIMDPELKKKFEELQRLMEQNNKEQMEKKLDEIKLGDKEVEKELDRMMELFKQLEFEQKLDETIEKLEKLAEEQEKLSEKSQDKDKNADELKKEQQELNKKFDELKEDLKELEEKNEDLENKNQMEDTEKEQQDVDKEMEKSEQQLEKQQKNKASESQKNAAKKMQDMKKKLQSMQAKMQKEAAEEDYQALRQILENLVYVSQEQEKLMDEFGLVKQYNPQYVEMAQRQRKLKDDAKMIEDSLLALSKRVIQIQSFVNREIGEVNFNMDNSLGSLAERNTPAARMYQQHTMTHLNNLALMLSEIQQNMQESMMQSQCDGPNCPKPKKKGKGKGMSMEKMKQMQEELSKQIEEMKQGMKEGQQGQQGQKLNQKLAEMAAHQEALRRQLQRINEEINKSGGKKLGDLEKIQELMEKNEEDLVNRRFTEEMLKRQREIMVRLLESEKAEKEQETDNERKAEQAKDRSNPAPPLLEKYLRAKEKEVELLRTVPPALNSYYRQKVKTYFQGTSPASQQ